MQNRVAPAAFALPGSLAHGGYFEQRFTIPSPVS